MSESNGGSGIVAGWYPDPAGRFELRYHNGEVWTADVSTDGQRFVDPEGTRPSPRPAAGEGGRNGPAITAMVLGITSIALGWIPFVFLLGAIAAVLAIVFGVAGRRRARLTGSGSGYALTGLITGAVGALVCVGGLVFTSVFLDALDAYSNPEPNETQIDSCALDGTVATARGTITNTGSKTADYAIRVEFVRAGTSIVARRVRVEVDDLPPGETVPFSVSRAVSVDQVDCLISRVDGPLPFGVEVEN